MAPRARRRRGADARRRARPGATAARQDRLAAARALAARRFGIRRLLPFQARALEAVLGGRDTLAVLPTGYGKSLIYQLPALLARRPTLVVSPLLALMADQERSLRSRGAPVVRVDGTLGAAERRAALARVRRGGRLIVLTTPETLRNAAPRSPLSTLRPALFCVDEAHCISEWGHDFRPAYLSLAEARERLGGPPVLALTATATPRVRADVAARLAMRAPRVVVAPIRRANLRLSVEPVTSASKPLRGGELLRTLPRPGIVYCATIADTDAVHRVLLRAGVACARYHGKLGKRERAEAQARFLAQRPSVMVATSAFGMGIDKRDVRYVLHWQTPGSLEQYVQEAGRAGRDGAPAHCILLWDPADLGIQQHLQQQGRATSSQVTKLVRALAAWAGERRSAGAKELALSAAVPAAVAGTLLAELRDRGALSEDRRGRFRIARGGPPLADAAREVVRRLETRRREDEERLGALTGYAATLECRGVYLARWFGEEQVVPCGLCDRCRPRERGRARGRRRPRRRERA